MTLENTAVTNEAEQTSAPVDTSASLAEDGSSYDKVWDKLTVGDRADDGKFKGAEAEVAQEEAAAEEAKQTEQVAAQPVTLPANMTPDMADIFEGMPPERAQKLTAWADKLHRQMSDQGRQLGALKPFNDVASSYPEYFERPGMPAPPDAFNRMMAVQKLLDTDPIAGLRQIADAYGITEQSFGGGLATEAAQLRATIGELRQQISSMASPDAIRGQIESISRERSAADEVSRFAQSKPLYADVEAVLPDFVGLAKRQLGDGATPGALLERAYDMAVNALPETRAKQNAAAQAAPAANAKAEAAKKAASINIKGAPTGARQYASDEEAMSAAFDRAIGA